MTAATLVRANLRRRLRRTVLTVLGLAVALFLFVVLRSIVTTMQNTGSVGSESRLVVGNKLGIVFPLPIAYRARLAAIPGVTTVSWWNWFGGVYIDSHHFFAQFSVDPRTYLKLYPEIKLPEAQKQTFLGDRTGAIVGQELAQRYGFKLGQSITLKGTIYPGDWPFTIDGIFTDTRGGFDANVMYFHYDYLAQMQRSRSGVEGLVQNFRLGLSDPRNAARIAHQIDTEFENAEFQTKTQTDRAYALSFASLYGNVTFFLNVIGTAVAVAILLVVGNTLAMSARERTPELALLKSLGFGGRFIVGLNLAEAGAIAALGLVLGLGTAWFMLNVAHFSGGGILVGLHVAGSTAAVAAGLAALIALASGAMPAWHALRLNVVTALRYTA